MGYSPQGHKESDTTKRLHFHHVWSSCFCVHPATLLSPTPEPFCPPHQPTSSSYLEDKHLPSKHGHGVKVPVTDVGPIGGIFGLIGDGRPGGGPGLRGHLSRGS